VGGAALAATIYLTVTAICMVVYVLKTARYRPLNLLRNFPSPDIAVIRGIIQLSLPIAVTMLMDAGFFTVIALLMGQLGRVGLAAHQIVINYSTLVFMIPVGLSSAIMVRVGESMGCGKVEQVRFRACLGLLTVAVFMVPFSILAAATPGLIINVYSGDLSVISLPFVLMTVASSFLIFDGLKISGEGALRGMKETTSPMIISLISYWLVGFPAAWLFGIYLDFGPVGLWYGMLLGMILASALMGIIFLVKSNRLLQ